MKNSLERSKCSLPRLKDYSKEKAEKLKSFFRSNRSISENKIIQSKLKTSKLLYNDEFSDDHNVMAYYMKSSEKLFGMRQMINSTSLKSDQEETKKKNFPLGLLKHSSSPLKQIKTETEVEQFKDQDLNNQNEMECLSFQQEISQNEDQDYDMLSEESSSDEPKRFDGIELQQEIKKIQHKLHQEIDQSYFYFIKRQDRLRDLAINFNKKNVDPINFYCLNDNIFPKRIDLSNSLINNKEMHFSDLGLTEKYFPLIKNLLQSVKSKAVKQLFLCNNQLDDKSLLYLIEGFPMALKEINLGNNVLGRRGAGIIVSHIQKFLNLKSLNLQNNLLGDKGATLLLSSIQRNMTIIKLNLSENQITDSCSTVFYQFLLQNNFIENLVLNWNQLGQTTGTMIAKGLQQNRSVKVLDLSYNHLGQNERSNCIQCWCEAISNPQFSLVHLDISYNQLSEKQLKQFSQALLKNNSLYGLHIEGNKCSAKIDPYGFIKFINDSEEFKVVQQKKNVIDGVNYIPIQGDNLFGNDCCWICQGWMEYRFQYNPENDSNQDPIFIHLDFLDYQPIPMTSSYELRQQLIEASKRKSSQLDLTTGEIIHQLKQLVNSEKRITLAAITEAYTEETSKKSEEITKQMIQELSRFYYTTYQMCPPKKKILYFFSNPIREEYFIDPRVMNMSAPLDDLILQGKDPKHSIHIFQDGTKLAFKKIQFVNYIYSRQEYIIDDKDNYKPLIKVFPRSSQKKYVLRRFANCLVRKQAHLIKWNKDDSIFRPYIGDTEELLNECFEFDWNSSKISRFVKSEYERIKLKEYFRSNYQLLKDVYKFYSSLGYQPPNFDVFCIQIPQYMKLINKLAIIDGDLLKQQDVEIDIVSLKNNIDPKYIYNPDKALVRYQFLEMFFRIANDKYIRNDIYKSYADALFRLLKEFKEQYEYFDNIQEWRTQRLWTRECDHLLQIKMPFVKKLYDYVTDIANRKWYFKLKWISIREFKEFCRQFNLHEYLSEKQQVIIYNFSMMTQVDELTLDRNIRMTFIEFVEALGRIAERISAAPITDSIDNYTILQRQLLPLHIKLETLLTYLYYQMKQKDIEFEQFCDLFVYFKPDQSPKISMPKVDKTKKPEKDHDYHNVISSFTLYNAVSYLNQNRQPYLNPKYKQYLKQNVIQTAPIRPFQHIFQSDKIRKPRLIPDPQNLELRSNHQLQNKQQSPNMQTTLSQNA
ncbi:unnamed protein product [Paramecium pentaurelia]|uniref:Leucine Rich Repeat family protein n=1 Tax=Paramecium pentaurelia TaxID=43138 RepID=A0A8S1VC53_9CILI|nr:unnamed protein product [Paramecium pentaurelia]